MVTRGDEPASALFYGCSGRRVWAAARSPLSEFCNRRRSRSTAAWTHTNRRAQVPAGIPSRHACRRKHSHPVVPVAAARDVRRPFGTGGGFEVEVVVHERHAEPWLQERRQPVNIIDSWREISTGGPHLDVWRGQASEEDKMLLDCGVRVDLLQGQVHSSLQGLGELTVSIPLGLRGGKQSSNAEHQQQQQRQRRCSHLPLCICQSVCMEGRPSLSPPLFFPVRKQLWFSLELNSSTNR